MHKESKHNIHKNKIYCGTVIFNALKKEMGVLYGNEFRFKSVTLTHDGMLHPRQILTLDKELKQLLKELEVKFQENSHGHR
jgi:hypothetical protein